MEEGKGFPEEPETPQNPFPQSVHPVTLRGGGAVGRWAMDGGGAALPDDGGAALSNDGGAGGRWAMVGAGGGAALSDDGGAVVPWAMDGGGAALSDDGGAVGRWAMVSGGAALSDDGGAVGRWAMVGGGAALSDDGGAVVPWEMDGGGTALSDDDAISSSAWPIAAVARGGIRFENCYMFKSRLHQYTMKVGLPTPEYHTLQEGTSNEPVFKSTVVVNNTSYESLPGFHRRKAAEHSAAEVAFLEIAMSAPLTEIRSIQIRSIHGLWKDVLQEYAQKMNYAIPSYSCTQQGSGASAFICIVEVGGILYIGAAARTKKGAEIKAVQTALRAIQGQSEGGANGARTYIVIPGQRPDKETDKKPVETPKPHKVKKRGFKRKWNKRKFMRMADQTVDAEKDVEEGLGMPLHYDYEEARRIEYDLSRDSAMVQFNKEVITMQPGEGDRILQLEPPRDPAEVQHNKEARSAEQDPPSNTEMMKSNNEAATIEYESVSPPSNTEVMKSNNEATTIVYESVSPSSNTEVMKSNNEATTIEYESVSAYVALRSNGDSIDVEAPSNTSVMQGEESVSTMQEASHSW